jgi:hypothetical protein
MEDPAKVNEGIRRAVALMTAWNESADSDTSFAILLASQDLAEAAVKGTLLEESVDLIVGLMSLSARLMVELEAHTGTDISAILRRAGEEAAD